MTAKRKPTSAVKPTLLDIKLANLAADFRSMHGMQLRTLEQITLIQKHGARLVEHCERLMREKQALLRAQHAEDPTPHRLDMLDDDVTAIQDHIRKLYEKMQAFRREAKSRQEKRVEDWVAGRAGGE